MMLKTSTSSEPCTHLATRASSTGPRSSWRRWISSYSTFTELH